MTTALPASLNDLTPKQKQDFWASVAARDQTYGNNAGYEPKVGDKLQWINNAKDAKTTAATDSPALTPFADNSPNLAGWTIDTIISNDQFNTRIVIYKNANTGDVMVVPMGTDGFTDVQGWLANIKDAGLSQWTVKSPKGSANTTTVQEALFGRIADIYKTQGAQLIFTGDSKGGALIQVMAYDFIENLKDTRFTLFDSNAVLKAIKNSSISLFGSVSPSATDAIRRELNPNYNPTDPKYDGILAIFTAPAGEWVSKLGGLGYLGAGNVIYEFSEGLKKVGLFESVTYLHRIVNGFYDFAKATNADLSKVKLVERKPLEGGYFDDAFAMFAKLGLGDGSQNGLESKARIITALVGALAFGPLVPFQQSITDTNRSAFDKTLNVINKFLLGGTTTAFILDTFVGKRLAQVYVSGLLLQTAYSKGRDALNTMFGKPTFVGTEVSTFNDKQFMDYLRAELSKIDTLPVIAVENASGFSLVSLNPATASSNASTDIYNVYTIKAGDTVSQLAQKFGISEGTLLAFNPEITNKDLILTGGNLTVPVAIATSGRLTLSPELQKVAPADMAKLLGFDINTLKAANPTVDFANLPQNQTLNLPTTITNAFNLPSTLNINVNLFDSLSWLNPSAKNAAIGSNLNLNLGDDSPIVFQTPTVSSTNDAVNTSNGMVAITGNAKSQSTVNNSAYWDIKNGTVVTATNKNPINYIVNGNVVGWAAAGTLTYYTGIRTPQGIEKTWAQLGYSDPNLSTLTDLNVVDTLVANYLNQTSPTYVSTIDARCDIGYVFGDPYANQSLNFKNTSLQNSGVDLGFKTLSSQEMSDANVSGYLLTGQAISTQDINLLLAYNNSGFNSTGFICPLGYADPIIWDMNGDGFSITSVQNSRVRFDVDNDGYYEQTAWFSNGSGQDAVLAIDLNGNGAVDGAWELMSEYFNAKPTTGKSYANGFDALKQFDELDRGGNKDGQISSADLISSKLFWWRDDGDGIDETGEHIGFNSYTGALSLTPTSTNQDYNGSTLALTTTYNGKAVGQFYFSNYTTGTAFAKDSTGALYTLSEASKQIGVIATSSNNTINMTDKNLRAANGGEGNDVINGSASDNVLAGGTGSDTLNGGAGNDTLYIDASDVLSNISGGTGFDTLVVTQTSSVNIAMSAMGIEQIIANNGDDIISGVGNSSIFVKAGAGKDVVMGSNANDILSGGDGDDLLMGGAGTDVLRGEAGDDTLIGGANTDWMYGSTGNDTYVVDVATDSIIENSNEGIDSVQSSLNYILGANVENLALLGTAVITGAGNTLNNHLLGNNANNVLTGLAGDDTLDGSAGADTLVGGLGNDSYVVDMTTDTITENLNEGIDTVQSSVSYELGLNVETLTLTGTATHGKGNVLANTLIGNSSNNILDGGVGADTLSGGLGDDTYLIDNALDVITENAAEGTDTIQSTLTYSLFSLSNFENLTLIGAATTNATGNTLNNVLIGNSANNVLDGAAGKDTLIGGLGNDTYLVDNILDVIRENNAEGIDSVQSNVSYTLSDNVENLTLLASAFLLSATGNGLNNMLTGNAVTNILTGLLGDDTLDGGGGGDSLLGGLGNDTYIVDNVSDVVTESVAEGTDTVQSSVNYSVLENVENLTLTGTAVINGAGNTLNNVLLGNSANNILDGRGGADTLKGGLGNDTYLVDNTSDAIVENMAEGSDSVQSTVTYSLSANVENLTLMGAAVIDGTGSAVDNLLTGNSANNTLTGLSGNDTLNGGVGVDTLKGGLGDDAYLVDNTSDVIIENMAEGLDSVQSIVTYSLSANVENLTLMGVAVIDGTGSAVDNVLTGNSANNTLTGLLGNDTLDGGVGADTLIGGAGNDTYVIDSTLDVVRENIAEGIDSIKSSFNYILSDYLENLTLANYTSSSSYTAVSGTGNSADNVLIGNNTRNLLTGLLGNDTLDGGSYGDTLVGGLGNDTYIVDDAEDIVKENSLEGIDTVLSSVGYSLAADVENITLIAGGYANGNSLDNILIGNNASNALNGLLGNDTLDGGAGTDRLWGGAGNDTYLVDNISDEVTEYLSEGIDSIKSAVTYSLSTHVENLALTGALAIDGTGNVLDNILLGNNASNTLTGLLGNDTLDGGIGVDVLVGGLGNDTYLVDNTGDVITENLSEGADSVQSTATYQLSANVENLTLVGTTAISGTGNILANLLTGNSANNTLTGMLGNDTLNGGAGADALVGGIGDDTYFVDNVADAITELFSEGTDSVQSTVTYSLSANVENLMLMGTATVNGTGNTSNNMLTGNAANNILDGGVGADSLVGGLGNDTYIIDNTLDVVTESFSEGVDLVHSSATYTIASNVENLALTGTLAIDGTGNDLYNILIGNDANNTLRGLLGNDTLNGGIGADNLIGGLGNDLYYVDNVGDTIAELVGEGTDSVYASFTYGLTANVENLALTGAIAIDGTGNELNNYVTGNSANNTLRGLLGNDTLNGGIGADSLIGGLGNDAYVIDNAGDVITELVGEGTDSVYASFTYGLTANVENLVLTGALAIDGTGNELNNYVTGNSANNTLRGLLGNDTLIGGVGADSLIGGLGSDIYYVDNVGDTVAELVGEGTDGVYASFTYGLTANVENLVLTGALAIDGTGNELNNYVTGNNANNILKGLLGNDILNGGVGADSLIGGLGNDIYYVDNVGDTIAELVGEGTDSVYASFTYGLTANVENLALTGAIAIDGTGNSLDNILVGNDANNVLTGQLGNDTLSGGLGADTLYGGAGNDTYIVDDIGDKVIEVDIRFSLRGDLTAIGLTSSGLAITDGSARQGVLSPDGKKILFYSDNALVTGDTNGKGDFYVKDLLTGEVTCVSTNQQGQVMSSENARAEFSPDGRRVLFESKGSLVISDINSRNDIYIKDLQTGVVQRVSNDSIANQRDGSIYDHYSYDAHFVNDGTQITFISRASWLVPQDTNFIHDVFIKNIETGEIKLISTDILGQQPYGIAGYTSVSRDGRKIVFDTNATIVIAEDGTRPRSEVFVKDVMTGAMIQSNINISIDINGNGLTKNVERLSTDGSKILFTSYATNLVSNDTNNMPDVFLKDLITGKIQQISVRHDGIQANGASSQASFSPDGTKVVFVSAASNLVDRDINNNVDVFIKDLITGEIYLADTDAEGVQMPKGWNPEFSPDGTRIVFNSDRITLSSNQGTTDLFVKNLTVSLDDGGIDTVQSSINYTLGEGLEKLVLTGSSSINGFGNSLNNTITGNNGSNVITGGFGNDALVGGLGSDTYRFGRGNGVDTIVDVDSTAANTDTLQFLEGVNHDQLWFSHIGNDLQVSLIGTSDKVIIQNWYSGAIYRTEQIRTTESSENTLAASNVELLVAAMAGFSTPAMGQTTLNTAQHTALDGVIATAWS